MSTLNVSLKAFFQKAISFNYKLIKTLKLKIMEKINGYLISNRLAELLQRIVPLPVYVRKEFDKHFTGEAILASWIQYNTYPQSINKSLLANSDSEKDYIDYMFRKCAEYDKVSEQLFIHKVHQDEDIGEWFCTIVENNPF